MEDLVVSEPGEFDLLAGANVRRTYAAPRVVHRQPLEVIAAVCAPTPPAKANPGFCPEGPISS
jgi:hypothetical protein